MSTQRILLPIDAVLDTRLATIEKIDEAAALKLLENGYRTRCIDDFDTLTGGVISNSVFHEQYNARDIETLKLARVTGIAPLLNQLAHGLEVQGIQDPNICEIVVHLNCWPYELPQSVIDAFIVSVGAYTSLSTRVEVVNIPFEELTPKLLKEDYAAVFMYDFNRWQNYFVKQIVENKMPDVTIIAPMLFHTRVPTDAELADDDGEPLNPWAATEALYTELFRLVMCDVALFSVVSL